MVEYRALKDGEWEQCLDLWTKVFGVGAWLFQSLHESTANRKPKHTRVAVQDGRVVATVDIFLRHLRGVDGTPLLVGGIGSVATHDDARKQGHSGRLLEQAIAVMEMEGCDWSFLFTGVNAHYEKYGWHTVNLPERIAHVALQPADISAEWTVEPFLPEDAHLLPQMAKVYDSFNVTRPLTHVRSEECWKIATSIRMNRPDKRTWIVRPSAGGEISAYVVTQFFEDRIAIKEACFLPGAESAMVAAFETVREEALALNIADLNLQLPDDSALNGPLAALATGLETVNTYYAMARPIGNKMSLEQVLNLFEAPGAHHWELDAF